MQDDIESLFNGYSDTFAKIAFFYHTDKSISVTDSKSGIVHTTKTARVVSVINVEEHSRHLAVCITNLGKEWEVFAKSFRQLGNEMANGLGMQWGYRHIGMTGDLRETSLTKNMFFFTNRLIVSRAEIVSGFRMKMLKATIIDDAFWEAKMAANKPDAILCHDARDEEFASMLYHELAQLGLNIWYSEYSLLVGDDLAGSIDRGLTNSRFAILVISKNLLENAGWARSEMNSVLNRQSADNESSHVLPVWLDVEKAEVAARSTLLANRVALKASDGVGVVATKLASVIDRRR